MIIFCFEYAIQPWHHTCLNGFYQNYSGKLNKFDPFIYNIYKKMLFIGDINNYNKNININKFLNLVIEMTFCHC